jgi:hypothetical protein
MVFQRTIAALALLTSLLAPCNKLTRAFAGTLIAKECNLQTGPCTITAGKRTVTLNIEPKPFRAMQELSFTVTVRPCVALPASLLLDLAMPDMEMGKNQITLLRKSDCRYEGKGVIVRCMSHRTIWRATILSDELHNPAFTFNVRE